MEYKTEQDLIDAGYVEVEKGLWKEDDMYLFRNKSKIEPCGIVDYPIGGSDDGRCFRKVEKSCEKKCNNCGYSDNRVCNYFRINSMYCIGYSGWKPKETKNPPYNFKNNSDDYKQPTEDLYNNKKYYGIAATGKSTPEPTYEETKAAISKLTSSLYLTSNFEIDDTFLDNYQPEEEL